MTRRHLSLLAIAALIAAAWVGPWALRPGIAQVPVAPAPPAGRYQAINVPGLNNLGVLVVIDTETGRCWTRSPHDDRANWIPMGSPAERRPLK